MLASDAIQVLTTFIRKFEIQHVYGMPGDSVNGLIELVNNLEDCDLTVVYNEKTAGAAAVHTYLLTGKPAMAIGTEGPGSSHLLQSIAFCKDHSIPALFVVGESPPEKEKGGFQDINLTMVFQSLEIPYFDLHECRSADELLNLNLHGPIVLGVSTQLLIANKLTIRLSSGPYIVVNDRLRTSGLRVSSTPLKQILSESIGLNIDALEQSGLDIDLLTEDGRPAGWLAGYFTVVSLLTKRPEIQVISSINDLADGLADIMEALSKLRHVKITIPIRSHEELSARRACSMLLSVSSEVEIDIVPAEKCNIRFFDSPVETIIEWRESKYKFSGPCIEQVTLGSGGFGRLGARLLFRSPDLFHLLAASNSIFDALLDGVDVKVLVDDESDKGTASMVFGRENHMDNLAFSCSGFNGEIEQLARAISDSSRPILVAGSGSLPFKQAIREFCERYAIPIATTMGADWAYRNTISYIGMVGANGTFRTESIRARSDLQLLVGVSNRGAVHGTSGAVKNTWEIDPFDSAPSKYRTPTEHIIFGDPASAFKAIDKFVIRVHRPTSWKRSLRRCRNNLSMKPGRSISCKIKQRKLTASYAIRYLLDFLDPSNTLVTADVGVNTLFSIRNIPYQFKVLWTKSFATMGFGPSAALMLSKLLPGYQVSVVGDGALNLIGGSLLGDFKELKGTPVIVIINNGGLAAVKFEQQVFGLLPECWEQNDRLIRSLNLLDNVNYLEVHSHKDLTKAVNLIKQTSNIPVVLNIYTDPNELPMPALDVNWVVRTRLIMSWIRQGKHGFTSARYILPGLIQKWRKQ